MCPPVYEWEDQISGERVEIVRSIAESHLPPDQDPKRDWVRLLSVTSWRRGDGWSGSKGNWLLLIGVLGCSTLWHNWLG